MAALRAAGYQSAEGYLAATRVAVATVDLCLGRLWKAVRKAGGILLVTADHGNAEEMVQRKGDRVLTDADGRPLVRTSHSLNPVPFVVLDSQDGLALRDDAAGGSIARIGTTLLQLCGVSAPDDYLPGLVELP